MSVRQGTRQASTARLTQIKKTGANQIISIMVKYPLVLTIKACKSQLLFPFWYTRSLSLPNVNGDPPPHLVERTRVDIATSVAWQKPRLKRRPHPSTNELDSTDFASVTSLEGLSSELRPRISCRNKTNKPRRMSLPSSTGLLQLSI